ncbi:hypothetical protein, partial [Flavobacterium sp.]|uniref:hypothetical protein n=1 Tax=Flavobacterium sp. TaxID=239 RepID=UPI002C36CBAC
NLKYASGGGKFLEYVAFLKIRKILFLHHYFTIFVYNQTEVFSQTDVSTHFTNTVEWKYYHTKR